MVNLSKTLVLKKNQNYLLKKKEESKKKNKKNKIKLIYLFKIKVIKVFFKFSNQRINV